MTTQTLVSNSAPPTSPLHTRHRQSWRRTTVLRTLAVTLALVAPLAVAVVGPQAPAAAVMPGTAGLPAIPLANPSGGPDCSGKYFRSPNWYCPSSSQPTVAKKTITDQRYVLLDKFSSAPGSGTFTLQSANIICKAKTVSVTNAVQVQAGVNITKSSVAEFNASGAYAHEWTTANEYRSCTQQSYSVTCDRWGSTNRMALLFTVEDYTTLVFNQTYERVKEATVYDGDGGFYRDWITDGNTKYNFWTSSSTSWVKGSHHSACRSYAEWKDRPVGYTTKNL